MRKLINRRLSVKKSMPPLAEACAHFKGFKAGEKRTDQIFELLLAVIQRCRGAEAKRFYTMREVAAFFGVAIRTVETVYHQLNAEGVLIRVRSSHTMITARSPRPRLAIRGVVCMPIWLPGFLQFLDWRRWFSLLEEELSRYRFAVEPIFYKQGEETSPAFVDRVLKFNPDYILWHNPNKGDITTMHSLGDAGVPLIVVKDSPENFPGRIYRENYLRALKQGLQEWEKSGRIDRIVIPQREGWKPSAEITAALNACAVPHGFKTFRLKGKISMAEYVRRLATSSRTGIIFVDDLFYTYLCLMLSGAMLSLFRRHRVMIVRQAVLPTMLVPDQSVDALLFPWKQMARRIASDLNQAKSSVTSSQILFEAEWHPRLPLKKIAQFDFSE